MLKSPPSLAAKLGIDVTRKAFVIGQVEDLVLAAALEGATVAKAKDAGMIVAMIASETDLAKTLKTATAVPDNPIWCVHAKGKAAVFGDSAIRTVMRENRYIDSKTCAVSERLTATRYRLRHF
jgi:hypothetical protein